MSLMVIITILSLLIGILSVIFTPYIAVIPAFAIGVKIPSFFFGLIINGMFIFSYIGQGIFSGYRTLIAVGFATIATVFYKDKKIIQREISPIIVAFFLFGIYMSISLLWTTAPNYGLFKVQGYWLGTFIPFIMLLEYLRKDISRLQVISNICIVFSIIASVLLLIEHGGFSLGDRTSIEGVNPIWYCRYIGSGLIFSFNKCFIVNNHNYLSRIFWFAVSVLLLLGLMMNGSRGPLISVILAIIFLECVNLIRTKNKSAKAYRTCQIVLLLIIATFLLSIIPRFSYQYMIQDVNIFDRLFFVQEAMKGMFDKLILGWGIGGFSIVYKGLDTRIYPHNIILEVGVELGIIGLMFIIFILYCLAKMRHNLFRSNNGQVWSSLFVFLFVNALLSGDLFGNASMWLPVAAMIQIHKFNEITEQIKAPYIAGGL